MMDPSELRTKSPDELRDELLKLRKEAFNLRFQAGNSELSNTVRVREVRRDTARVLTVLNEKNEPRSAD